MAHDGAVGFERVSFMVRHAYQEGSQDKADL